jgi:hypothetical protein
MFVGNLKLDFSSNFIEPGIDTLISKLSANKPSDIIRESYSRDFTCNSLLMNLELNKIYDPTNKGISDINSKILRCCISPEVTLKSKANRIARILYLAPKLNFEVDPAIVAWVKNNPEEIREAGDSYVIKMVNRGLSYNAEKVSGLLTNMNLWKSVPITDDLYPYYKKFISEKT